jgi:prolyl oligopeptidase
MNSVRKGIHIPGPPKTPRRPVTDNVHGTLIVDAYRWLEDGKDAETVVWTKAQNERTGEVLGQLPEKDALAKQLMALVSRDFVGTPVFRGRRLFYTLRQAGAEQAVLCMRELSGGSAERVLVDPNKMSDKGLVALDWWQPSDDGSMVAYGCSERGDEWSVLRVLDVDSGEVLPDRIERARMAGVNWEKDNTGFYYCRYPKPGEVPPGEENYNHHLFHHRLGDDPSADPKVFGQGRPKEEFYHTTFSDDGRYLLLTVTHGWSSSDVYYRDETAPAPQFVPVVVGEQALFQDGKIVGDTLYLLSNYKAPRYKVCSVDLDRPGLENWRDLIPEDPSLTLDRLGICGGSILVGGLKDATSRLYLYDMDGSSKREVLLPMLGTVSSVTGQFARTEAFFRFESFALAPAIYRVYVDGSGAPEMFLSSDQPEGVRPIVVQQAFYRSKDGTTVPMFVLQRRDAGDAGTRERPRPTVLTGYGGFNLGRTPTYSDSVIPWLMNGGVYAVANLRGGNEYGEDWHKAGMRENKQNVFDDFIAAAEHLIGKRYTDRAHLGIWGRSNGGLLVGAALTQRPDLFTAVACGVPLLDMVRYHKSLIAHLWCSEYGNPDVPEEFAWLYAYSPYHRVRKGIRYPSVYFYTALSDSRVDPLHARKMTALLQEVQAETGSPNPILLRVESDAGHGSGKPIRKIVDEQAEMWAFLAWRLGLDIS